MTFSLKESNSKLVRWRLKLEEFDFEIIYIKAFLNKNADALSRIRQNFQTIEADNDILDENYNLVHYISSDKKFG